MISLNQLNNINLNQLVVCCDSDEDLKNIGNSNTDSNTDADSKISLNGKKIVLDKDNLANTLKILIEMLGGEVIYKEDVDQILDIYPKLDKSENGIVENNENGDEQFSLKIKNGVISQSGDAEENKYNSKFKYILIDNYNGDDLYEFSIVDGIMQTKKLTDKSIPDKILKYIEFYDEEQDKNIRFFIYNGIITTGEL